LSGILFTDDIFRVESSMMTRYISKPGLEKLMQNDLKLTNIEMESLLTENSSQQLENAEIGVKVKKGSTGVCQAGPAQHYSNLHS
jgi:hypothetical protein